MKVHLPARDLLSDEGRLHALLDSATLALGKHLLVQPDVPAALAAELQVNVRTLAGGRLHVCPFCHQTAVPSLQHVCWTCPRFADLRRCLAPRSVLVARLGWDQQGIDHAVLSQLGCIRKRVLNLLRMSGSRPARGRADEHLSAH